MDVNCGVLNTLEAWARNSSARDSLMGNVFDNAMLKAIEPGPSMLLRLASPNCPLGGDTNAAVLSHSVTVGFDRPTCCPVTLSRNEPFAPALTSRTLLRLHSRLSRPRKFPTRRAERSD